MALGTTETWDALFSDFYLRAFADEARDAEAREQALAAARLSGCPDGGDLLDVPCGFGRHSVPLARAGYRVVAVDRSQALLDEARRRAGGDRWPKLAHADYRDLPLPDESFDAALNLFSSLGYLGDEDDTKALAEIRRVLRPGGRLVIEIMHRDALVLRFRDTGLAHGRRGPAAARAAHVRSGRRAWRRPRRRSSSRAGERDSRTFSLRVYAATELLAMLARAGFEESRCYGDLAGGGFRATAAWSSSRAAEARQPVVRDRLPVRRRLQPLVPAAAGFPGSPSTAPRRIPDGPRRAGVAAHRWPPQCDADDSGTRRPGATCAPRRRPRRPRSPLRRHHRVQRPRRAAAPLAALAMAVPGGLERLRDLEPHRPRCA